MNALSRLALIAAVAAPLMSASQLARAEGEGTNFMEDRVAMILMEQAQRANMPVCEAVLIPTTGGQFRIEYRVVRAGAPQVARPANGMTALVANPAGCPR
jgi:hypothetical protein